MIPLSKVDITPQHLKTVTGLLRRYLPDREVWAFGSRVSGHSWKYSDLNLAVMGAEFPDHLAMFHLRADLAETRLPYIVDLKIWAGLAPGWRDEIRRCCAVIHSPDQPPLPADPTLAAATAEHP